jgi:hypothetical protein
MMEDFKNGGLEQTTNELARYPGGMVVRAAV